MPSRSQQIAFERMTRADYQAFLMNRGLRPSTQALLLFNIEKHNKKRPLNTVVFTDARPPANDPARGPSSQDQQVDDTKSNTRKTQELASTYKFNLAHSPSLDSPSVRAPSSVATPSTTQTPAPRKKPTPSKTRRSLARLLPTIYSALLADARTTALSLSPTPTELLHLRQTYLPELPSMAEYQRRAAEALAVFQAFLDDAVTRGIDIRAEGGKVVWRNGYVGRREEGLGAEDGAMFEGFVGAWERVIVGACWVAVLEVVVGSDDAEVGEGSQGGDGGDEKAAEGVQDDEVDAVDVAELVENMEFDLRCA